MAKKKKASLKPVNRGFATTSAPSKKAEVVEEPEDDALTPRPGNADGAQIAGGPSVGGEIRAGADASNGVQGADWEKEEGEGVYQGYVERLQEKADKEVLRVLKGMGFDRRMNKGFIPLTIDRRLRDEMLQLHMETKVGGGIATGTDLIPATALPTGPPREKALTKLYVTRKILLESGFGEADVREYLSRPLVGGVASNGGMVGEDEGWEGALGHMWLEREPRSTKVA